MVCFSSRDFAGIFEPIEFLAASRNMIAISLPYLPCELSEVQELFPIGSVVKLRNGIRPLMIFGIKQTNLETNEEYDYIGVLYPEGNMGDKTQFLFNHEDIEEVISKGYTDETWEDFIKRMREFYKEI